MVGNGRHSEPYQSETQSKYQSVHIHESSPESRVQLSQTPFVDVCVCVCVGGGGGVLGTRLLSSDDPPLMITWVTCPHRASVLTKIGSNSQIGCYWTSRRISFVKENRASYSYNRAGLMWRWMWQIQEVCEMSQTLCLCVIGSSRYDF